MNRTYLTKSGFEAIFNMCMKVTKCWNGYEDIECKPTCTIRVFELNLPYPDCDKEFTNFEKAWKYLQRVDNVRIMDAYGNIYCDMFDDEVRGE